MSKGNSGLFNTKVSFSDMLREDYFDRFGPDGAKNLDFSSLPGSKGTEVPRRLSSNQMLFLTNEYGIEFAQVYVLGDGKNGRGGKYYVYSGDRSSVKVPLSSKTILISHTHPGGTAYPSTQDMRLMDLLKQFGSPQKTSTIFPNGKAAVKFTSKGKKK